MKCPRCLDAEVRYSFKAPIERVFTALLPISPFRCRACRHRFWRLDRPVLNPIRGLTLGLITLVLVLGTIRAAGVLHEVLEDRPGSTLSTSAGPELGLESQENGLAISDVDPEGATFEIPSETDELLGLAVDPGSILKDLGMDEGEMPQALEGVASQGSLALNGSSQAPAKVSSKASPIPAPEVSSAALAPKKQLQGRLERLRAVERGGTLEIEVVSGTSLRDFRGFSVENPRRLVVDLPGVWSSTLPRDLIMNHHLASGVRIGRHGDRLRLVVDLMPDAQSVPKVRPTSDGLVIEVHPVSLQPLPL